MHSRSTYFVVSGVSGLVAVGLGYGLSQGAWIWAFVAGVAWAAASYFGFGRHSGSQSPIDSESESQASESSDFAVYDSDVRALLDAVPALIAVIDANSRFEYANRAQTTLFGSPENGVAGKTVLELLGETSLALIEPYILRVLRGDEFHFEIEIPNQKVGGRPLHFDSVFVPRFDSRGSVSGFYSLSTNITRIRVSDGERRMLDQQTMQSEKLESLGILAGDLAHDFNNLLVSMMANVDLIRRDLARGAPVAEELRQIEIAARTAARLCSQMLDYSGQSNTGLELVDLSSLASQMPKLLGSSLPSLVTLQVDSNAPPAPVEGDPGRLRQVIMSLITNAWEAMPDGEGTITIHSGVIGADADVLSGSYIDDSLTPGRYAFFQVNDNGCGMDDEVLSNLFDPFFSTKFTGRGLGLAAALGIVRGHRGAISVESKPNVGTEIRVLIPVFEAQPQVDARREADSINDWQGSGTVLVVDDDLGLRRATNRILSGCGLSPLMAASGAEALEIIRGLPADSLDLIVLDLTMPAMDGAETLALIRKIDARVPVLLCSGYTEAEVSERCKGLEYSGMLAKPFGFYTFARTIRALLEP